MQPGSDVALWQRHVYLSANLRSILPVFEVPVVSLLGVGLSAFLQYMQGWHPISTGFPSNDLKLNYWKSIVHLSYCQ